MLKQVIIAATVALGFTAGAAQAAGEAKPIPAQEWSFSGIFGTYDRAELQRGFQVYKEVCSGCHALALKAYRNLADLGFSEDEVKAIAAQYKVMDGPNDAGEMFERAARPSDKFVKPYPNENAARANNNGAYPPDLSLITKARANGSNYLYALLTGYQQAPADVTLENGQYYNPYFPGGKIAMPAPIAAGGVTYADGTEATVQQMSRDVTAFLTWAAEPEMERRKRLGIQVMLFLLITTGLLYAVKRKIWADVH